MQFCQYILTLKFVDSISKIILSLFSATIQAHNRYYYL